MSGKFHLICMKHAKIRCNLNDISYLSETQKKNLSILTITTSFFILSPKYFIIIFFLKITLHLITLCAFRL